MYHRALRGARGRGRRETPPSRDALLRSAGGLRGTAQAPPLGGCRGKGVGVRQGGFRPPEVYGALWRSCFVFVRLLVGLYVCLFALCESRRDGVVVCHWFIHSFGRMNEYAKNGLRKTLSPFEAAHPRSSRNNSLRGPPQYLH